MIYINFDSYFLKSNVEILEFKLIWELKDVYKGKKKL